MADQISGKSFYNKISRSSLGMEVKTYIITILPGWHKIMENFLALSTTHLQKKKDHKFKVDSWR